jgi:hypothetical protein
MKKVVLPIILLAILILTGCNNTGIPVAKQASLPSPTASPIATPIPTVEVKRSSSDCQVVSQSQLPTNFPSDIPYPDGAKLVAVSCPDVTDNFLITFNIMSPPDDIFSKLQSQLKNLGWAIDPASETRDNYLAYYKYPILLANKGTRSVIYDIREKKQGEITEILIRERL